MPLEQTEIRVGHIAALREANVEEIVPRGELKGVLHVEKDLFVGPIDEPVQLDGAALVQIGGMKFIIRDLWGLNERPLLR